MDEMTNYVCYGWCQFYRPSSKKCVIICYMLCVKCMHYILWPKLFDDVYLEVNALLANAKAVFCKFRKRTWEL